MLMNNDHGTKRMREREQEREREKVWPEESVPNDVIKSIATCACKPASRPHAYEHRKHTCTQNKSLVRNELHIIV